MWLLNSTTLELRAFVSDIPRYAILSHVWEATDHPHIFQEVQAIYAQCRSSGEDPRALVNDKVRKFCAFAEGRGFEWVWLDTCCIDKSNSAELSEAVNSMHVWYREAVACIAFLCDVGDYSDPRLDDSEFQRSRWHTRGWTLQELLIPRDVIFVSRDWNVIGTKTSLGLYLEPVIGIKWDILVGRSEISSVCVAQRLSWMSRRETTRPEDRAYSLLGIFGVQMPIVYGEGLARAFFRLQKIILKSTPDQSILAGGAIAPDIDAAVAALLWPDMRTIPDVPSYSEALTTSPSDFALYGDMKEETSIRPLVSERCTWTSKGLVCDLLLSNEFMPCPVSHDYGIYAALLPYCKQDVHIVLFLRMRPEDVSRDSTVVPLATLGCDLKLQDSDRYRVYRGALLKDYTPDHGHHTDFTVTKVCIQSRVRIKSKEARSRPDRLLQAPSALTTATVSAASTEKPTSFYIPYWCLRRMEVISGFVLEERRVALSGDGHRLDASMMDYANPTPFVIVFTNVITHAVVTIRLAPAECHCSRSSVGPCWWMEVHLREPSQDADALSRRPYATLHTYSEYGRLLYGPFGGYPYCSCMGNAAPFRNRVYVGNMRKYDYIEFHDGPQRSFIMECKFIKTSPSIPGKDEIHIMIMLVAVGFERRSLPVDPPVDNSDMHVPTESQHSQVPAPVPPVNGEPVSMHWLSDRNWFLDLGSRAYQAVHNNALSAILSLPKWITASPDYSYGSLV